MKRQLLLSLATILLALPALARDFEYTYEGQTLTYTVLDENAKTCQTKAGGYDSDSGLVCAGNTVSNYLALSSIVSDGSNNYTLVGIGEHAFFECDNLISVTIPNSVTEIGDFAFDGCIGMTFADIPNSVTRIGGYAFRHCSGLTSITIPNSVTYIGFYAFMDCSGLKSVTIPNSVTQIGGGVFANCKNLLTINVAQENRYFTDQNGILYSKDMSKLMIYPAGKNQQSFDIPNSVTTIDYAAFNGCMNLTAVTIPQSVTTICGYAFVGCTGLTSLTIPNSVTSIGTMAFEKCRNLNTIIIGNSVTNIGTYAFVSCFNIMEIYSFAITPPECDAGSFDGVLKQSCTLYVPDESVAAYSQAEIWREFHNIRGLSENNHDDSEDVTFPDWQSTNHSDDSTSEKMYNFSVVPGNVLTFNYAVDSEEYYDELIVKLNDETVLTKSGNQSGHYSKKFTASADVTLTLSYTKDGSESAGEDCAWVTDIILQKQPFGGQPYVGKEFEYTYEGQTITYVITDIEAKTCKTKAGGWGNSGNNISGDLILPSTVYDGSDSYTLTEIGEYAFSNCSSLTSVVIPNSVTKIENWSFGYCNGLISITIPSSVTTISYHAFYECSSLASVTLPNSISYIGEYAFHGCGLNSIHIPNSTYINSGAFSACVNLTAIDVDPDNSYYTAQNGILYSKDMSVLIQYPAGKNQQTFEIPNCAIAIGSGAFSGCTNLTSVIIPNSITAIGGWAFSSCSGLNSITIPNSVSRIETSTFKSCSNLTSVIIPNSVTVIGAEAFEYCSNLTTIIIPNYVTEIDGRAFNGCYNLQTIEVLAVTPPSCGDTNIFSNETYSNAILKVPANAVDAYKSAEVWKEFTNIVSRNEDNPGDDSEDVTFPDWQSTNHSDDSTSEKVYTFSVAAGNVLTFKYAVDSEENYDKLIVKLNDETVLTKSGNQSGHYSKKFTATADVTLTLSYTKDGSESAGEDCAWVTDIILHKQPFGGQPYVGKEFEYTYEGQTITYVITDLEAKTCKTKAGDWDNPGNNISGDLILPSTVYDGSDSYTLTEIGEYAFRYCNSLTSVNIPNSVIMIGEGAFSGCWDLTSVSIPNSVAKINDHTFSSCSKLTSISLPNSITEIGLQAFSSCKKLSSINLPNSIRLIDGSAFEKCHGLSSISIPSSVTVIGDGAFRDCTNLTEINVTPENSYFTAHNGILFSKDMSRLIQYPAGKNQQTFDIPNTVTTIGGYAFEGCSSLTSITISESTSVIGERAFGDCSSLTSVSIPNSISEIGSGAFQCCSGLTSVTIPNSVTRINGWIFNGCSKLTSIIIPNSVTEISYSAFENCSGLTSVTIGNSVTKIANFAFSGCYSLQTIDVLALTPPSLYGPNVFSNETYGNAVLKVLANAVESYKSAEVWKEFSNIVGFNYEQQPFEATIDGLHYILNPTNHCATVTYSEQNSLSNYEGRLSIIIPEAVESDNESYIVTGIGDEAFNNCWGLKAVSLPSTLEYIGKLAFGYCTSLRSIAIPDEVTIIDDEAFTGCSALASATIGNSVEAIGDYAFFGCTGLAAIRVPQSVKTIGENAFMGIHWLNEVRAESTIPAEAPASAFSNNAYKSATLVVPDGSIDNYKSHPTWSNFMTIREISNVSSIIEVVDDAIMVKGAENVRIYNTSGAQVYAGESGRIELPSGIYLVVTDTVTKKVRI